MNGLLHKRWALVSLSIWIGASLIPGSGRVCSAQGSGTPPATEPPAETSAAPQPAESKPLEALTAEVLALKGMVDVLRPGVDADWVPAEVGMRLPRLSEISTGFESEAEVHFELPGVQEKQDERRATFVVRSLTILRIAELAKGPDALEGKVLLKNGTVFLDLRTDRVGRTSIDVATPRSTTSVRGTAVEVTSFSDTGDVVYFERGTGVVEDQQQRRLEIVAGERTTEKLEAPAEVKLVESRVYIEPIGTTEEEKVAIVQSDQETTKPISDENTNNPAADDKQTQESTVVEVLPPPPAPPSSQ